MIMRKILIISITAFTAALFIGCSDSDYSYTSNYIYKNDSSRDITMKSYNYANGDLLEDANYTFVILPEKPIHCVLTLKADSRIHLCGQARQVRIILSFRTERNNLQTPDTHPLEKINYSDQKRMKS